MILSPQQERVIQKLIPLTRLASSGKAAGMAVRPKTHSLIIGPSGVGKSFLVRQLAASLNLPLYETCATAWMVLGARAEPRWQTLAKWINRHPDGMIFVDEIDKIDAPNEWTQHIRLEVHDLLDGRLPNSVKITVEESDHSVWDGNDCQELEARNRVTARLKNRIMIVAAGAWQSKWRENQTTIGYH